MANYAYMINGGNPTLRKYKIGATQSTAGVPILETATATAGLAAASTTSAANAVGITIDTGTYTTTQSATMTEGTVTVNISAQAVFAFPMLGGAAAGTALITTTNSSASAGGTVVTISTTPADPAPNSPTMVDGTAYCVYGANFGVSRIITSVAATTATVTVPFPNAIAVNDVFVLVPIAGGSVGSKLVQFSTNLASVNMAAAVAATAKVRTVDIFFDFYGTRTSTTAYLSNSVAYMKLIDHIFALDT